MFEKFEMSKARISLLFKIAVAFVVAGAVSGAAVLIAALANGAIAFGGPHIVTINPGPIAEAIVGLSIASVLTGVGTCVAIASWVGALVNTWRLEDKTWFVALLVLGLASLSWVAVIAYVLRGPDSNPVMTRNAAS
jgi:hypothetical protein